MLSTGVVFDGQRELIPGLAVTNYLDDPRLALRVGDGPGFDGRARRASWVRAIVLHTTMGIWPQQVCESLDSDDDPDRAERITTYWSSRRDVFAGAQFIVNGPWVACTCDIARVCAYHAPPVNDITDGIEMYQDAKGRISVATLFTTLRLVDWLTGRRRNQRQIPSLYTGAPVPRLVAGGADVVGVYGHRDVTHDRGRGDPGDPIFILFRDAGYETVNLHSGEDRARWHARQRDLAGDGLYTAALDGIPGPRYSAALEAAGHKGGMWVQR